MDPVWRVKAATAARGIKEHSEAEQKTARPGLLKTGVGRLYWGYPLGP